MESSEGALLFEEEQRIPRAWLWLLVPILSAGSLAAILAMVFAEGERSVGRVIGVVSVLTVTNVVVLTLMLKLRLVVEVDRRAIRVRMPPLVDRRLRLEDVTAWEAREYRPIREYGGWGIRYSLRNGRAYNMSGRYGVQLVMANGKRILIGSQRAEELAEAIDKAKSPRRR